MMISKVVYLHSGEAHLPPLVLLSPDVLHHFHLEHHLCCLQLA